MEQIMYGLGVLTGFFIMIGKETYNLIKGK